MNATTSTTPQPFIPDHAHVAEFTVRAIVMGTLLGMIFGASSLYLVLKVGLTVSASIPVAVIAITLFRLYSKAGGRDSTILENNIVQTAGSAGESIAFGLGVTMPAILILGFDLEIARVLLVGVLGGLLGILMMIPLRRTMIVAQHDTLRYPEGTACAEVLKAAELTKRDVSVNQDAAQNGNRAGVIFLGFAVGLAYKALNVAFKGWKDVPEKVFGAPLKGGSVGCEVSPELLGVGYLIGPRIASIMCAGGVMAYLFLIPLIQFFGDALSAPLAPGTKLIRDMSPNDIRGAYVLYIGAGAVAAGGLVSLLQAMPTIWRSLRGAFASFSVANVSDGIKRTDQDIPMKWVLIGCLAIMVVIMLAAPLHMNFLGALLIIVFGFIFATVSSRLTGEIGSSSNPISGMTVATLLFTCLIFLVVGWTGGPYYVTALSVGAIVCIASSNAGTTSQDLKTGFLVGATPRLQQYAILFGALASAVLLGPILLKLNDAATVYVPAAQVAPGLKTNASVLTEIAALQGPQAAQDSRTYRVWHKADALGGPAGKYLVDETGAAAYLVDPGINGTHNKRPDGSEVRKYDAPKAVLMSYIIKGILDQQLPWALVIFGAMIALILEMAGVASLPFAVGVYLPLSSSLPIFVGGAVRWAVDRRSNKARDQNSAHAGESAEVRQAASDRSAGVLLASGYIAGGALAGIIIAFMAGVLTDFDKTITEWSAAHNPFFEGANADLLSIAPYAVLIALLFWIGTKREAEKV